MFPWGLGVDFFILGKGVLACLPWARLTYAVIYLFFPIFLLSGFLGFYYLGGMDITFSRI